MKKYYKGIFAVGLLGLLSSVVFAQSAVDPMNLPALTQWVTDFSTTLSTSQLDELNTIAKDYETQSSNQIVAVVFPNRNGYELIDIGMKIFTDNGIGRKDVNNGLLLVISSEEKKIRIIVGYGLEGVYPDLMASQVIENDVRPLVNSGDIAGAIKVFYDRSQQIIGGEIPVGYSTTSEDDSSYIFIFFGFILGYFLRFFYRNKKLKKILPKIGNNFWIALAIGIVVIAIFTLVTQFVLYFLMGVLFGFGGIWVGKGGGGGGFGGGFGGGGGGGFGGGGGGSGGGGAGD